MTLQLGLCQLLLYRTQDQRDQIARLFIQCLAIYYNKTFPDSVKIVKVGSKLYQTLITPDKIAQNLLKKIQSGEISIKLVTLPRTTMLAQLSD